MSVIQYMLDTCICVELLRGRAEILSRRLTRQKWRAIGISCITLAELRHGVMKSSNPINQMGLLVDFCAPLDIRPFDIMATAAYGEIRSELEKMGNTDRPLGHSDRRTCKINGHYAHYQQRTGVQTSQGFEG